MRPNSANEDRRFLASIEDSNRTLGGKCYVMTPKQAVELNRIWRHATDYKHHTRPAGGTR